MNMVRQEDKRGSALACVAMVMGLPYEVVRARALKTSTWNHLRGASNEGLKQLLRSYRKIVRYTTREAKESGTALVSVMTETPNLRQWVLWHDGRVLDPETCNTYASIEAFCADAGAHTGFWLWTDAAPVHGTASTYSNHKCRCFECRVAWSRYCAGNRDRRLASGICIQCTEPRYLHHVRCKKHYDAEPRKTQRTTTTRKTRPPNAVVPHRGEARRS
jgi:hypothetical protein